MKSRTKPNRIKDPESFPGLDHLVYKSGNQWVPLPQWARFFIELGSALSCYEKGDTRFVVVLSLPIRSFASSLISAGIIISRIDLLSQTDKRHIEIIASLKRGTPVSFRKPNKQMKGIFMGTVTRGGRSYFEIIAGNTSHYYPFESANKIEILDKDRFLLPKNQTSKTLNPPSPLLKKILSKDLLFKFSMESKVECVILGQIKRLQHELCNTQLGFQNLEDGQIASGTLQDLVRVRDARFQPANMSHRSIVCPPNRRLSNQELNKFLNYVTVFDSHNGYLKWRHFYRKSNWIVILDRTEGNFENTIQVINDEYIKFREDSMFRVSIPKPPAGIELMMYEVKDESPD